MAHIVRSISTTNGVVSKTVSQVKSGSALNARRYWKAERTKQKLGYEESESGLVVTTTDGDGNTVKRVWVDV